MPDHTEPALVISLEDDGLNCSNKVLPLGDGVDGSNEPSEKGDQQSGISPAQQRAEMRSPGGQAAERQDGIWPRQLGFKFSFEADRLCYLAYALLAFVSVSLKWG